VRVLLDECLPRKLGRELQGHVVSTVQQAGWSGVKNGALLALAAGEYDVFITIDRLLTTQHRVPANLAVITLHAPNNTITALRPLLPALLDALAAIHPGEIRRLGV
jgi:hypothetical protein